MADHVSSSFLPFFANSHGHSPLNQQYSPDKKLFYREIKIFSMVPWSNKGSEHKTLKLLRVTLVAEVFSLDFSCEPQCAQTAVG